MSLCISINLVFMGDDNNGLPFFAELCQEFHNLYTRFAIQRSSRFIGKKNRWVSNQRSGNRNALLLSSGHLIGHIINFIGESDFLEGLKRALLSFLLSYILIKKRHNHLIDRTRPREEIITLEDKSNILTTYECLIVVRQS